MNELNLDKGQEFRLSDIFKNKNLKFRIPIYQRNYAWGEQEINRLFLDIKDNKQDQYYLGTLVLYKNGDYYDVIDGQQRLTTLFLLLQWIKKRENTETQKLEINQLHFESRPKVKSFIQLLLEKQKQNEVLTMLDTFEGLNSFKVALSVIHKFFEQELKADEVQNFIDSCLNKTYIFATALPEKTNVNHYFEIMNNRGEQLEKHEILKAKLLNKLVNNFSQQRFAEIWDACSQMDNHVQYYFETKTRKTLFGDNFNTYPTDERIQDYLKIQIEDNNVEQQDYIKDTKSKHTALYTLENHDLGVNYQQEVKKDKEGKWQSIINFENFLLHALSICTGEDVNLEDKNLLKNFEDYQEQVSFPSDFITHLLQIRYLFDKYLIKRELDENNDDWNWVIKDFEKYDNSFVQNNTFINGNENRKLIMLQSMFEVSYPTNTNKTWLRGLLKCLYLHRDRLEYKVIYQHLFDEMRTRFNKSNFEEAQGLHTPRAVFNFLDYLLWLEYEEHIKNEFAITNFNDKNYKKAIAANKEKFREFKFIQRNSIEHLFPQAKIDDLKMIVNNSNQDEKLEVINAFGNLCLISSSSNSSYNKEHPAFKKSKAYGKNESLKQHIMFTMMKNEKWGEDEIENHGQEMIELLNKKLNNHA